MRNVARHRGAPLLVLCAILSPLALAQLDHTKSKTGERLTVRPSADAVRAHTVNRYISNPNNQYSAKDFSNLNEHKKMQLKVIRPSESLGVFSDYGDLGIDGVGPKDSEGKNLFLHYNNDGVRKERDGRDTWGEPQTVCSALVFAAEWKKHCLEKYPSSGDACTLQIGDISMPNRDRPIVKERKGKKFYYCELLHQSHYNGNCVDVRPVSPSKLRAGAVRASSKSGPSDASIDPATVNRTKEAVDFALSLGATKTIWQSDGHYDHFHVCFPPGNTPDAQLGKNLTKNALKGCYGLM